MTDSYKDGHRAAGALRWAAAALSTFTILGVAGQALATDIPKQVTFAAGQPAMSIGTFLYSSLPQAAGLDERYAGVTVKVQPTAGSTPSMQAVSGGNGFFAWAGILAFIQIAERDPSLVMVSFDPGNPYRTYVLPDGPIKVPADLKGKKIGIQSYGSAGYGMTVATLAAAGLDPKRDVVFIPIGVGAVAADAIRTGKVDAYSGVDATQPVIDTLLGIELRALDSPVNKLPGMNGLVFTRTEIEQQPHLVAGLCRAFYAAPVFAGANPEATVRNHWMVYPTQRPSDPPSAADLAAGVKQLKARVANLDMPGEDGLYGYQSLTTMQGVLETFHRLGVLDVVPDLSKLVDLRFAKECGTIDAPALRREAAAWKPAEAPR